MSMSDKYLFDTSFEAEDLGGDTARPVRKPPPPKFDQEDLDRARAEGHAAGKETGTQEVMQSIEQQISQAVNAISEQLIGLSRAQVESHERRTSEALEVALAVVRKIFPRLAGSHGLAEIETIVHECLERLREEPRIVIRVADALLDQVETRIGELVARAGFEGRIVYLAQDGSNPGDVLVEWADGGAERNSEEMWREIDRITARVASSRATATPTEATESPEPAPVGPAPVDAVESA